MKLLHFGYLVLIVFSASFITHAQNQNISNGPVFDGEPYLTINPQNTNHLVAAWMGFQAGQKITIKSAYSLDGGMTWSSPIFQPHQVIGNSSADVSLSFDLSGNVYMAYIDYDNVNFTNGGIYVRKSTNGGISWGPAVEAISTMDCPNKLCVDRPWMVIDQSGGANSGTIYVTSMNADQPTLVSPPYNPYLSVSTDGGAIFSSPRFLDTLGFYAGSTISQPMPSPSIAANGTFYAMYPAYEPVNQGPFAHLYLSKSNSAGVSLEHIDAYSGAGNPISNSLLKRGSLFKCDPSDPNHMAYFYLSEINGDADIFFIESMNGGLSWTSPLRINQDPVSNGKLQDLVWADFDHDGDLAVCWRDRRNGSGNTYQETTEIYGVIRWKDSISFSSDFPISDTPASHDVVLEGDGNDFMNVRLLNDTLYAVWGDVRSGVLNIYLNKMSLLDGTSSISVISSESVRTPEIYPNPSSSRIYIKTEETFESFEICDASGKVVLKGNSFASEGIDIQTLKHGKYTLRLIIKNQFSEVSFIKD